MQPSDCLQAVFGVAAALLGLFAGIAANWREIRSLVIRDEAKQEVREIGRVLVESADDVGLDPETVERIGEHLAALGGLDPETVERIGEHLAALGDLEPEAVERIGEHLAALGDLEPEALEREAERAEER